MPVIQRLCQMQLQILLLGRRCWRIPGWLPSWATSPKMPWMAQLTLHGYRLCASGTAWPGQNPRMACNSSFPAAPTVAAVQEVLAHPRAAAQLGHFIWDVLAWRSCTRRRALVLVGPPSAEDRCLLLALTDQATQVHAHGFRSFHELVWMSGYLCACTGPRESPLRKGSLPAARPHGSGPPGADT